MDPLIINAAITGMVPVKKDNPHVPITPAEIVADACRCRDAGATIIHLHAREADGSATYKKEIYAEIFTSGGSIPKANRSCGLARPRPPSPPRVLGCASAAASTRFSA